MTHTISREIRLKNRPEGVPRETDFEFAEIQIPEMIVRIGPDPGNKKKLPRKDLK